MLLSFVQTPSVASSNWQTNHHNFDDISALPDVFYAYIYQAIDLMNMDTMNNITKWHW